jgi:hypothetical protein
VREQLGSVKRRDDPEPLSSLGSIKGKVFVGEVWALASLGALRRAAAGSVRSCVYADMSEWLWCPGLTRRAATRRRWERALRFCVRVRVVVVSLRGPRSTYGMKHGPEERVLEASGLLRWLLRQHELCERCTVSLRRHGMRRASSPSLA